VHDPEHAFVIRPGILIDSVQTQRLGRAAPALVEGGDKAARGSDFLHLLIELTHNGPRKFWWFLGLATVN
jgi:hypothetical protein